MVIWWMHVVKPFLAGGIPEIWKKQESKLAIAYLLRVNASCLFFQKQDFLFDLILYAPVNNFSAMSGRVFLGWTSTKPGLMWFALWHNAVPPVRLEPATLQYPVKHSTTEPLHSLLKEKLLSLAIFNMLIQVTLTSILCNIA